MNDYNNIIDDFNNRRSFRHDGFASDISWKYSTSIEDCLFLYFMVRKLKPKNMIEIGTWIGATTNFLARGLSDNDNKDGKLYTYDLNNKCSINDKNLLKYIVLNGNNHAHNSMKNLDVDVDMVF